MALGVTFDGVSRRATGVLQNDDATVFPLIESFPGWAMVHIRIILAVNRMVLPLLFKQFSALFGGGDVGFGDLIPPQQQQPQTARVEVMARAAGSMNQHSATIIVERWGLLVLVV